MARRFLYLVAIAVVLVIAGMFGLRYWARELSEFAFVPRARFEAPAPLPTGAYDDPARWIARADKPELVRWLPHGAEAGTRHDAPKDALVFYIHPTTLFDRSRWNAKLPDPQVDAQTDVFARAQASAFNAGEVWAPRYRQATFGAMLTAAPEGKAALDAAYRDVLAAFDTFVAKTDPGRPIVLVGHSQGALMLMRLMQERVAHTPFAARIAAAYVVGWPVSLTHDLPEMGLPACIGPDQAGCVLSWMSFAEPADPTATLDAYARDPGLDGANRKGSPILCTNPLTGRSALDSKPNEAPASANLGTLLPEASPTGAALMPGMVPARCGPDGMLLIGPAPQLGRDVMPGNNYHVYDIPLFWANVRADVARRVATWKRERQ